jgi:hypothetical protein
MKAVAVLLLLGALSCSLAKDVPRKNCSWRRQHGKRDIRCKSREVAVGACGSGRRKDCNGGFTALKCCDTPKLKVNRCKKQRTTRFGHQNLCQHNKIATGICGSGMFRDCIGRGDNTSKYANMIRCCNAKVNGKPIRKPSSCHWKWGRYGEHLECKRSEAMFGMCGSGLRNDCWNRRHKHGIYCCKIRI